MTINLDTLILILSMAAIFMHSRVVAMSVYMVLNGSKMYSLREKIDTIMTGILCCFFIVLQIDWISIGVWHVIGMERAILWSMVEVGIGIGFLRTLDYRFQFYKLVSEIRQNGPQI